MPLEHALILVKSLLQQKSANMELANQIQEIKVQVEETGFSIPFFSAQNNDIEEEDDDDESEEGNGSESLSSDSEDAEPAPGRTLLDQMIFVENKATAKALGASMRHKRSKPVEKKPNNKMA